MANQPDLAQEHIEVNGVPWCSCSTTWMFTTLVDGSRLIDKLEGGTMKFIGCAGNGYYWPDNEAAAKWLRDFGIPAKVVPGDCPLDGS